MILARMFSLLLLLVVSACIHREKEPLRVGTLLWPGSEPIFLARDLGYVDDSSIRLVEYTTLGRATREFRNGMLDAVFATLDIALQLQHQGLEPRVVLVIDHSLGADAIVARPGVVRGVEDLRGKRVAVEDLVVSMYVLGRALEQAGLKPSDIQLVRTPVDQQVRAYTSGDVDAVVTYEPFLQRLRDAGAQEIFDSSQIPGEIVDVLVVHEAVLEKNPAQVEHLVQGWLQGRRYLEEHPAEAVAHMSPRLGTSPSELTSMLKKLRLLTLEENLVLLRGPSSPLLASAQQLQRFMLKEGLLQKPMQPEQMLDARIIEALQEGR
ncbi:ABC transporter substrate-binding protein [Polyangium jinanense]|uniref:ABC transporter substrate-binding protein n=1 Tax=Polyangium jinanense TaxID=2829994 RepID=A0A9X4AXB5_9BACT|nr:ABC transporter substrate-binding protein [Polyangium jinanense]MDC3959551.1 ABC transporter substrate-binding protein [Polyangium jinanense]MDC3986150.1 ABC transporter substrate-binding protein [Polyangium jinanense]